MRAAGARRLALLAPAVLLSVTLTGGCARPLRQARLSHHEPETAEEHAAAARQETRACSGYWGLLFPGLGHLCTGRPAEGATLAALTAAELGTALAVARAGGQGVDHPGVALPLLAAQELWITGWADVVLDRQRAQRLRYVPPETLGELALAPFNPHALARVDVWAGILGSVAIGLGISLLAGERLDTGRFGEDANLFGRRFRPAAGYSLAAAAGVGLFGHVAVAEEATFRGWLQSGLSRTSDPTRGWVVSSLVFGAPHAVNVFFLPPEDRGRYLLLAVPAVTVLGSYMGLSYRWNGYSLTPPVAIHFWYDLLLGAAFFLADPERSPLSARLAIPF